jgi:uncharacterized protein (DUF362 family)
MTDNKRDKSIPGGIDRRTFMKIASLTGAGGLLFPRNLLAGFGPMQLTRVVMIEDSDATSGTSVDGAVVRDMMNCGIMRLTDIYDIGEAWKSLFTGITASSVIAIKVNCINSALSTHPDVAYAVAEGLSQMNFGGTPFPENNIIIYDRTNNELTNAGYTLNTSATGVRVFGTNQSGVGYTAGTYNVNGSSQRLSTIITDMADYMVNTSVLKNHSMAGVTLSLKNHYGTCNSPGSLHGGDCSPYIPALNALTPIRTKQLVSICDALLGIRSGGPSGSPQFASNKLIMSSDPVAVDYWGRQELLDNGCTTTGDAHHIDTAAGDPYNLGTNDPGEMDLVTITDTAGINTGADSPRGFVLRQNSPNPFRDRTRVNFYAAVPGPVSLTVYDAEGRRVRRLLEKDMGTGWHQVPWDGRNDSGSMVAGGVYFCQLKANGYEKAVVMQFVK